MFGYSGLDSSPVGTDIPLPLFEREALQTYWLRRPHCMNKRSKRASSLLFDLGHESRQSQIQRGSDPIDGIEGNICYSSLDLAHIGPTDPRRIGEAFLRVTPFRPQPTYRCPKRLRQCLLFHPANSGGLTPLALQSIGARPIGDKSALDPIYPSLLPHHEDVLRCDLSERFHR